MTSAAPSGCWAEIDSGRLGGRREASMEVTAKDQAGPGRERWVRWRRASSRLF